MAIPQVLTRGYGNGTFDGTIPLVLLRGYGEPAVVVDQQVFSFDVSLSTSLHLCVEVTKTLAADANMGNTSQQSAGFTQTLSADSAFSGGVEKGAEL